MWDHLTNTEVYMLKFLVIYLNLVFVCRDIECARDQSLPCCSVHYNTGQETELHNTGRVDNVEFTQNMSLPNCTGFFGTAKIGETTDIRSMDNLECPSDPSLQSCSSLLYNGKEPEIDNSSEMDKITQESAAMDDLSAIACLRLQLGGQQAYYPFSTLTVPEVKKLDVGKEMNFQDNSMSYQIQGNFEVPSSMYGNVQHAWNHPADACASNMIDGNSYPQVIVIPILCDIFQISDWIR